MLVLGTILMVKSYLHQKKSKGRGYALIDT